MRRILLVALVLGLIVAAAAPAGARDVSNGSQTMIQMQGYWSSYDDATGAWVDAGIYATEYSGETWIEYYRYSSTPITCEGDVPGTLYESFWGSGPGTLEAEKTYTAGSAFGTVTGWTETYTECWFGEEVVAPENGGGGEEMTLDVAAYFTATSPLIREKGSSSFKIPGETNFHDKYSSTYRYGDVEATVDGETFYGDGQLGKVTWRYHSNTK
jgi:hypothetical protein